MKTILNIIAIMFMSMTYAQLALTNLDTGLPIVDGDSFNSSTLDFEASKLKFRISNSSTTETINVLGQMVSFTNTDGTGTQFCVNPECFFDIQPGGTVPGSPIVLGPGQNNLNFDYFSNTNGGNGVDFPITYTLRFFMLDGNGNEVGNDITITYNYSPNVSTSEFNLQDLGIDVKNTVVRDFIYITAQRPFTADLFDLTGRQVKSVSGMNGQNEFNLSPLNTGIYLAKFIDESGRSSTIKIIKN